MGEKIWNMKQNWNIRSRYLISARVLCGVKGGKENDNSFKFVNRIPKNYGYWKIESGNATWKIYSLGL